MALRNMGYNVWWVAFDDAAAQGVVIPWHHMEGGMRLIFPDRESLDQALTLIALQGQPQIHMWLMTNFVPNFASWQAQIREIYPSFTEDMLS